MIIDTHAHVNFNAFHNDADRVIKKALDNNIWMINVGTQYNTSKKAVELAEKYPRGVFAAVGLHPLNLETGLVKIKNGKEETEVKTRGEKFDYQKYKKLANSNKVVAIGEIGLDYYWKPKTKSKKELLKEKQKELLLEQINLARELNLSIIFHCRLAYKDLIEILKNQNLEPKLKGVIHCFCGTWQEAKEFLKMGFYIGFNGIIFKKIEGIYFEELIQSTPLEKILVETDCPYLTPPGFPENRNNPFGVKCVAKEIARIKKTTFAKIAEETFQNARKLFNI